MWSRPYLTFVYYFPGFGGSWIESYVAALAVLCFLNEYLTCRRSRCITKLAAVTCC